MSQAYKFRANTFSDTCPRNSDTCPFLVLSCLLGQIRTRVLELRRTHAEHTQNDMVAQAREIDWLPLRASFIERPVRPTYEELGAEFGVKTSTVARCASDEGWVSLRAAKLEQKAKECDALAVMIEAAKVDRTILREVADYALVSIRAIKAAVEDVESPRAEGGMRAPNTRLEAHNTANFALHNLAKALHELGVVGVGKTLPAAGKEDNGRWNPEMLQQINVTVQNLQGQAAGAKAEPVPVAPAPGPTDLPVQASAE